MMTQQNDNKSPRSRSHSPQKKWLTLAVVGMALLLIPRRSSRKDNGYVHHVPDNDNDNDND